MACGDDTLDLVIKQGKTFVQVLQWEQGKLVYRPIVSATAADPCVLGVPSHGMPDGWHFKIVNAKSMTALNFDPDTGLGANGLDEYVNTLRDVDTIELNDVQAGSFKPYTGGGSIVYRAPFDLVGYTGRMEVKDGFESTTVLLTLTTANGGIVLDNTLKTITIFIDDTDTAAITWDSAVYDLELVSAGGVVSEIVRGQIIVEPEVTT